MAQKVFVGLSGGVDSSVSAALLKEQGYEVVGVFIKVWHPEFLPCTWPEERRSAIAAASAIGIPFVTLDLEEEYKQHVVDYMIAEYKAGRTPNPDVMCNQHIKFGGFLEYAKKEGADFVATGHYVRRVESGGVTQLHEGVDAEKDQSYFLWTLTKEQAEHALFPVGEFEKPKVRELARKFDLPTADKKDSQGLCFLGKVDMKEFLQNYIEKKEGDVLNEEGATIGTHEGAVFYTIGQRHGFLIHEKNTERTRLYVVSKDTEANTLTVSSSPESKEHNPKVIRLSKVNWISGKTPESANYDARIRYRGKRERCFLHLEKGETFIYFKERQSGLSSGQSLVLYDGTNCLGGGIIEQLS